ncbi:MAG: C10 family peptidase, partial [Muribaculaceae bacterium]|nr:C10 family peptidase [Muribaculaceae bacterium]
MQGATGEEAAYAMAQRFFESHTDNKVAKIISESSPQLELVASDGDCYVFNRSGAPGFVIVDPAADGGGALLGYSFDGVFVDETPVAAQLRSMLDSYNALAEKPVVVSLYGRYDAVAPLLGEIKWNQEEPYNLDCPVVSGTDFVGNPVERRAPAGCVPTAVGQIMRYHTFPSDYDWNLILPDYSVAEASDKQKKEVARLLYDIGRGVGARYDVFSTSASSTNVLPYLTTLGYSGSAVYHEYYKSNPAAWEPMILEELKAGRPVYMDGVGTNGHAFICDGNDADGYLHINWGWGGMSNGYFNPVLLSPPSQGIGGGDAGYNSWQAIITGLVPEGAQNATGSFNFTGFNPGPDGRSYSMDVTEWRSDFVWDIAGADHPAYKCEWGLRILDTEGGVAADVAASGTGDCTLGEYSLPDGRYRIYPVWRRNASDAWHYFWPMRGEYPFAEMAVNGGIASCSRVEVPDSYGVEMSGLVMPEMIDPAVSAKLSYTLSCTHGWFGGKVYAVISEQSSGTTFNRVAISTAARPEMIYGQSIRLEVPVVDLFGADVNLEQGKTYKVRFETEEGNEIYSTDGVRFATHAFPLTDIKDAAFRNAVARNSDFNNDGIINDYEILNTFDLNLGNAGIETLAGIEKFFKTVNVIANGNNLTSVDIHGMPEAKCFWLQNNPQLKSIKIRDCGDLDILYAENCALETLSLPENLNITDGLTLRVSNNKLSGIDVSGINAFREF